MKIEICDEQVDYIVVEFLKYHISRCEQPDDDPYESNDKKAYTLSSLYRTLKYCTTKGEYKRFVEDMKNARNSF